MPTAPTTNPKPKAVKKPKAPAKITKARIDVLNIVEARMLAVRGMQMPLNTSYTLKTTTLYRWILTNIRESTEDGVVAFIDTDLAHMAGDPNLSEFREPLLTYLVELQSAMRTGADLPGIPGEQIEEEDMRLAAAKRPSAAKGTEAGAEATGEATTAATSRAQALIASRRKPAVEPATPPAADDEDDRQVDLEDLITETKPTTDTAHAVSPDTEYRIVGKVHEREPVETMPVVAEKVSTPDVTKLLNWVGDNPAKNGLPALLEELVAYQESTNAVLEDIPNSLEEIVRPLSRLVEALPDLVTSMVREAMLSAIRTSMDMAKEKDVESGYAEAFAELEAEVKQQSKALAIIASSLMPEDHPGFDSLEDLINSAE